MIAHTLRGAASLQPPWSTSQIPAQQGLLNETQSEITSNTMVAQNISSGVMHVRAHTNTTQRKKPHKQTKQNKNLPHNISIAFLATSQGCFTFPFEIGSQCVVLAGLEFTMQTRLAANTRN